MTAERFTRGWVRTYTRGLSDEVRTARCEEIDSDLHEHRTTGAHGAAIVGRALRGVAADVSWRREERRAVEAINGRLTGVRAMWATATQAWFTPLAALLGVLNVLGAAVILSGVDGSNGSGRVIGPVILSTLAGAMFAGLRLRWRAGQSFTADDQSVRTEHTASGSTLRQRIGLGATALLGVVAVVFGVTGSGFLLIAGVLAIAGVVAIAMGSHRAGAQTRATRHSAGDEHVMLADVLIVLGTLPALGLFWLVIPTILALLVIGGVIGTGPGTRRRAAYSG